MMRLNAVATIGLMSAALCACQTMNAMTDAVTGSASASDASKAPQAAAPAAAPSTTTAVAQARVTGGLAGMSADGLRSAWGEPALKRAETGVELWQYGGSSCTLLVYLYPDANNTMAVSRAEAVPGGTDDAAVTACAKAAGKPPLKPIS